MRVGVVGPVYPDSLADNVLDALSRMGHEGVSLGPALPGWGKRGVTALVELAMRTPAVDAAVQRPLVRRARGARLDVVLTIDARLANDTVRALRDLGSAVGLWFPDSVANLGRALMFVAPYDAVFVKDPLLAERTRALLDVPMLYVPEACNPRWHAPPSDAEHRPELAVVGNLYPSRVRLLERLVAVGLPLRIWGPPPPRWLASPTLASRHTNRYVSGLDKARVFREAAAVLNALHPAEMAGVNCRLFEAAASGAAVLTEARTALTDLFAPEEQVLAFANFDELVDRARWALASPAQARQLGDRASARAHAEHTYEHRLRTMLATLTGAAP